MKESYVLSAKNISKKYQGENILQNLNLNIKKGEIYGLIGKNGAGKTTLIRMIAGTTSITNGEILLFGSTSSSMKKRVGTLIENPTFYPDMSARDNMEFMRIQKGVPGKDCIDEKLKLVGLYEDRKKKVKNFSLGMKQKLGIAMLLIGDPEFLILDEPTNGIDAMSVNQIRNVLKKLNKERNVTILISSHFISELDKLVTKYGLVQGGRIAHEVTIQELEEKKRGHIKLKVSSLEKACYILETKLDIKNYKVKNDKELNIYEMLDNIELISKSLTDGGIIISSLSTQEENSEDYFLNVIGGGVNA